MQSSMCRYGVPWLDINMIQTSTRFYRHTHEFVLKDYSRLPAKPTLDAETKYENSHRT